MHHCFGAFFISDEWWTENAAEITIVHIMLFKKLITSDSDQTHTAGH